DDLLSGGETEEGPAMRAPTRPPDYHLVVSHEHVFHRKMHIGKGRTQCGNRLSDALGPMDITSAFPKVAPIAHQVVRNNFINHLEIALMPDFLEQSPHHRLEGF